MGSFYWTKTGGTYPVLALGAGEVQIEYRYKRNRAQRIWVPLGEGWRV